MKDKNCIFCKIAKGELEAKRVGESDNFFAVLDKFPTTNGHTLIIPKKHFVTLLDIPDNLGKELLKFTKEISGKILDDKLGDGFNLIMNNLEVAGQVVMHAHIHVVPRKESDGFKTISKE